MAYSAPSFVLKYERRIPLNKNSSKMGATMIIENRAIAEVGPLVNESFRNLTATCSLFVGFVIRETTISTK